MLDISNGICLCFGKGTKRVDTVTLPLSYSQSYVICGGSIFEKPNGDYTEAFYDLTLSSFSYYLDPYGTWESKEINWITVGY